MTTPQKILACVDQSPSADHVTDYAAWAAARTGLPLELLHVLDREQATATLENRSGAIGIDATETLLSTLADNDEARSRAAREQGRLFLNRLRLRAVAAGAADTDVRQRHGTLQSTLVEAEPSTRLFVLGRRGEAAEATRRDLGRNVEGIVRALKTPILTVTDGFRAPARVMIAFDGGSVTRRGVDQITREPLLRGLAMHLLMCGEERPDRRRQLNDAAAALNAAGSPTTSSLVAGDPERVIAAAIGEYDIDLLVMGAWGHSPLRALLMGSKTTELLRAARVPTLLLRAP